ncbi:MAG: holo-ACP synthase [Nitrospirae bacterium]|nr:holo-ACP synthase [Nitrospirota bacterium]
MIYHGIDIVYVPKFRAIASRCGAFLTELFTAGELNECMGRREPFICLAGRFAAKEAFLKALGTGFTASGVFKEIEVISSPSGKPMAQLTGWAGKLANLRKTASIALSISHSGEYATASVIINTSTNTSDEAGYSKDAG